MPGKKFDKDVKTAKDERQWKHVYDSALKRGQSKASAIRQANSVVGPKRGHK